MRTLISDAILTVVIGNEARLVPDGRLASTNADARGANERLATVMRHNAAALLLNRALLEFQGERPIG